ncbi:MAG: hypothetical protein K0S53_407 [Bacteroidetes bacterium]|jgi:hypothetical protein|nr:hypothetical protein [Bacteroidota bacterium]
MANVQDINITSDFDIEIKDGDFNIVDSDPNHIELIIKCNVGAYKEYPLVGFGIDYYLASNGTEQLIKRNLSVQLKADNYQVNEIKINKGTGNNVEYFVDALRIQ